MPRLEVELTSARPDGTWTWRKAGARQPKGELAGSLLPAESKVGDVLRVETEALIDGIEITSVLPPKAAKSEKFERIEIKGRPAPDQLVSTTLAPKRERRGREGEGRRDRGERRDRGDRAERGERRDRPQRPRPPDLVLPDRPKPKRLRPGRSHRDEVLGSLPPEEQALAEQVLAGGVPAVRQAVDQQNKANRDAGRPEVKGDELVALAERLLPTLRAAEWLDRAEAALAIVEQIDLRDLRSVVVAAEAVRGDETRDLETSLRDALNRRVEEEHEAWIEELRLTLKAERSVRALRLSSRPPKAGSPLPADVAQQLTDAATAAMTAETGADRWVTVLDALALSPIRMTVAPASIPDPVPDEVHKAVVAVAARVPLVAERFGIDPTTAPKPKRRGGGAGKTRGKTSGGAAKPAAAIPPPPPVVAAAVEVSEEAPVVSEETPVVSEETPVVSEEAPVVSEETPVVSEETPVVSEETPVASEEQTEATES